MNAQLLKDASANLAPLKVLLSNSEVWADDKLENESKMQSLDIETYNSTSKLIVDELIPVEGDTKEPLYVYKFFYDVGIRGVEPLSNSNSNSLQENDSYEEEVDPTVLFEIKTRFKAMYTSKIQLEDECVSEFAKYNVGHNVWPYWREFVQSSCSRMGIGIVDVPFYKIDKS